MCFRLRAAHGLFSALENCTDIVQMTDNKHKVGKSPSGAGLDSQTTLILIIDSLVQPHSGESPRLGQGGDAG